MSAMLRMLCRELFAKVWLWGPVVVDKLFIKRDGIQDRGERLAAARGTAKLGK